VRRWKFMFYGDTDDISRMLLWVVSFNFHEVTSGLRDAKWVTSRLSRKIWTENGGEIIGMIFACALFKLCMQFSCANLIAPLSIQIDRPCIGYYPCILALFQRRMPLRCPHLIAPFSVQMERRVKNVRNRKPVRDRPLQAQTRGLARFRQKQRRFASPSGAPHPILRSDFLVFRKGKIDFCMSVWAFLALLRISRAIHNSWRRNLWR
jgi:hypothetical protein